MGELKLKLKRDAFAAEIDHLAELTNVGWVHKKGDTDRSFVELKATFDNAADANYVRPLRGEAREEERDGQDGRNHGKTNCSGGDRV